jgi:hypothetical protein
MTEGHGFSRATSNHPTDPILSGAPQSHRGASTKERRTEGPKDQASQVAKLPTTASIRTAAHDKSELS